MIKKWYVEAAIRATVITVIFHFTCVLTIGHPLPVGCWAVGVGIFLWAVIKQVWKRVNEATQDSIM